MSGRSRDAQIHKNENFHEKSFEKSLQFFPVKFRGIFPEKWIFHEKKCTRNRPLGPIFRTFFSAENSVEFVAELIFRNFFLGKF